MRLAHLMLFLALLGLHAASAQAEHANSLWNDGEAEVILGAYFDEAGSDTIWQGDVPDTLDVTIVMWNGSTRDEGVVIAVEYLVDLPEGLMLLSEELPDYSNMAMGTALTGITQAIREQEGNGLFINTLKLVKTGELAYDSRIRIMPHPDSGKLSYVHRWGKNVQDIDVHLMTSQDAILNPKLSGAEFKPVKSSR